MDLCNEDCSDYSDIIIVDPCAKKVIDHDSLNKCYNKKVYENYCEKNTCQGYGGPDIFYVLKDAVVTIHTVTEFLATENSMEFSFTRGTGFFINNQYIVTSGQVLLFKGFNRFPPPHDKSFVRVGRVFVQVTNVNGKCQNHIYEVEIVGIDGSNDIGVLRIRYDFPWNCDLPIIDHHPFFKWGSSREYPTGGEAYIIGDVFGFDRQSLIKTIVAENHFNGFAGGGIFFEGIITDANSIPGLIGAPIIDNHGLLIGVVSFTLLFDNVGGVAQVVAERIVTTFIEGPIGKFPEHILFYSDPLGDFYRYRKGWLGINWNFLNAINLFNIPNLEYKNLLGIVVDPQQNDVLPASPLFSIFVPGDVYLLISINGSHLGPIAPQITPTAITNRTIPGCSVTLIYRKRSEGYGQCHEITVILADFPPQFDNIFGGYTKTKS